MRRHGARRPGRRHLRGRVPGPGGYLRVQGRPGRRVGRVVRARRRLRERAPPPGRARDGPRHLRRHDPPHRPDAARPGRELHGGGRRPGARPRAAAGRRRALLLRDDRPVRQRRPGQRHRRAGRRPAHDRLRPGRQGLLPGRRPRGPAREPRLHRGPGHDSDLAYPELPEPPRAGLRQRRQRRLPRLLDHRLHADRPAPGHQRRARGADRRRPRARPQGLLRHHHQPHGRRRRLHRGRLRLRGPGDRPVPGCRGQPVRPRRLRRHGRLPRARRRHELPVHPRRRPGRPGRQGPGLAQRPDALPQPGQLDVVRGVGHVRRLQRPGRPHDRAPARGRRLRGDLQGVDRPGHRRVPHRHGQARELRVLGGVVHRDRRVRPRAGRGRVLHLRGGVRRRRRQDLPVRAPHRHELSARLLVPVGRHELRQRQQRPPPGRPVRLRRPVHHPAQQRRRPADVPRQPRHGPRRLHAGGC